jgi:4-amino-4-deoxy-L-arabinose transferase-like glycosyltransferase
MARRFALGLGIIVFGALLLRVVFTVAVTAEPEDHPYDALYYVTQSQAIVDGDGFQQPFVDEPDAHHPPLTTLAVVPATALFGVPDDTLPQRLTMCLIGAAAVGVIGLLGRRVADDAVGWTAAVLAAVYPNLFINDGIVMAESLTALLVATVLLLAYRLREERTAIVAAGLGVACGLAALTRAELVLLLLFVAIPAALGAARAEWRAHARTCGVVVGVALVVMAPWVIRNLVAFDEPATLSTGDGAVLLGANCDRTYSGRFLGVWSLECSTAIDEISDAAVESRVQRETAFDYVGDHLDRVPVVIAARLGRAFDVFRPFQTADFGALEGRSRTAAVIGVVMYWLLIPFVVAGIVLSRRRPFVVWPLLVPFGIVMAVVVLGYGIPRFRVPAEPSIVVLASVAIVAAWRRLTGRDDQPAEPPSSSSPEPASTIAASSSS